MQISEKVQQLLNDQINLEFYSAQLYLALSIYFNLQNYEGFAKYMASKFDEETDHALKIIDFMTKVNISVELKDIKAPQINPISVVDPFSSAYYHEKDITQAINGIYQAAVAEGDFSVMSLMKDFIDEQVEEEGEALLNYTSINRVKDDIGAVEALNSEFMHKK